MPEPLKIRTFSLSGGRWIRTIEGIASRFTVCPLWPLGNSPIFNSGAGGRTRTPDLLITNQLLYQLSYTSKITSSNIIPNAVWFVNRNLLYFIEIFTVLQLRDYLIRQLPAEAEIPCKLQNGIDGARILCIQESIPKDILIKPDIRRINRAAQALHHIMILR